MSKISRIPCGLRAGGLLLGALSLSVGLGGGCGAPEAEPPAAPAPEAAAPAVPNRVASLRLQDGTQVDFHEPVPGRVLVIASAALPQLQGRIAPDALYESLSGGPAPAALVQAAERAALARALRASQGAAADRAVERSESLPDRQASGAPGVGSSARALSASAFSSSYCPSGSYNFYYCWTNRTGNGSIDISSVDWLRTYANAYRGQVLLSLSYRNVWGSWVQIASISVPEDTVKTLYTSDNDRYLVEITQAAGDGYHWSTYGDT